MTTLEKARLFERYLELTHGGTDTTLDVVLDKELPNAPHHVHLADGQVEGVQLPPDLETVLGEIEEHLGINS